VDVDGALESVDLIAQLLDDEPVPDYGDDARDETGDHPDDPAVHAGLPGRS